MAEAGSTLARSCGGETTVHPSIKLTERKDCSRNIESHTAAERDLGRAHRHTAYNQDRVSRIDFHHCSELLFYQIDCFKFLGEY